MWLKAWSCMVLLGAGTCEGWGLVGGPRGEGVSRASWVFSRGAVMDARVWPLAFCALCSEVVQPRQPPAPTLAWGLAAPRTEG